MLFRDNEKLCFDLQFLFKDTKSIHFKSCYVASLKTKKSDLKTSGFKCYEKEYHF